MNENVKKYLRVFAVIIAAVVTVMVLAMIAVYRESRQIEDKIQSKIDQVTPEIKIIKYDSLSQTRLDSIQARRSMSHRHVDNLYDGELQSFLDSLYNNSN